MSVVPAVDLAMQSASVLEMVDDYSALLADFIVRDVAALLLGLLRVLHAASKGITCYLDVRTMF